MSPYLDTITGALSAILEAVKASALEALKDLTGRLEALEALDLEGRLDEIERLEGDLGDALERRLDDLDDGDDLERRLDTLEGNTERQAWRLEERIEALEAFNEETITPALDALERALERELMTALYSVGGGAHETGAQILASNDDAEAPEVRAALEAALRGASGCEAPWGEHIVHVPLHEHAAVYGPWIANLEDRLERYARATVEDAIEGRPLKGERLTISLALSDLQRYFAEASPRPEDRGFEAARRALNILTDTLEE